MYKFFVEDKQIKENIVKILNDDVNHIKNVLRLEYEERIHVCNKDSFKNYLCKIVKISNNEIECEILEELDDTTEANTYIHIFQGLPKSDKLEYIIEKCTEIGVKEITPVIMKRSIVKIEEKDKSKKMARWNKIAEVAAKQSKRDSILKVNNITNFQNMFEKIKDYDILLVAYEEEKEKTLKNVLINLKDNKNKKIAVVIGPEGGIDEEEIKLCRANGFILVTLGKRILRTETAPLVISSNILYELED